MTASADPETTDTERLLDSAKDAARRAWCPYSRFSVGAAILMADGRTVSGCNVENASYGLTNCAERTAIFTAVAMGYRKGDFKALAIYAPGESPTSPCGACRQVMAEFFDPHAPVISCCDSGQMAKWTVRGLLPHGFGL